MCVCVRAACKDNQNIIMVKFTITTSRSMILILLSCIFLGSNDDRGWKKVWYVAWEPTFHQEYC